MKPSPHRHLFSQDPLAQLAVAFCAGICAANYLPTRLVLLLTTCAICSALALGAVLKGRLSTGGLSLLLASFFAGGTLAVIERRAEHSGGVKRLIVDKVITDGEPAVLTGVLDGPPEFARDRVYLSLRVENVSTRGTQVNSSGVVALLASFRTATSEEEYRNLNLRYGARLRVKTKLNRTDQYRNPGVSSLTEYLDRKGYDATGVVKGSTSIVRLEDASVFRPLAWLYAWRERLQGEIDGHFSPETAGVLDAALLGNRYNMSQATSDRFREGGTFHVLVISGLHISFIGGIVFLTLRRFTKSRLLQVVLSTTVVWGYSLAVGAEASVVRAALMFSFVALAAVVFRSAASLNALGGAALVILVRSPREIFDPSVQLTFLSVLAIVVIAWPMLQTFSAIGVWRPTRESPYPPRCSRGLKWFSEILFWSEKKWKGEIARSPHHYHLFKAPLAAWLERYHLQRCFRYIFGAIVVSGGVQVVLLPLLIVYFNRLSLASLVLNISVSLLLAVLAVVALLALLVSQVSVVMSEPLFDLANWIDWLMVHSVDPFAKLGLASIRLPEYSGKAWLIYVLYYLPLLALLVALSHWHPLGPYSKRRNQQHNRVVLMAAAQLVMLAVLVLHPFSAGRADGKLHVDFLDVGQGDAALVTMPDGTTLLVDGGGRPNFLNAPPAVPTEGTMETLERETRSIGETVVSEYLWWRGLHRVDYLLATHADADHIDGLNDVVRNFSVRSALVARRPANDLEFSRFSQALNTTKTHLETIQAGDVIRFGAVELRVLWPLASADADEASRNNDSVVLRLQFGERSLLLTGDVEKTAESALVRLQRSLRVDVVKVPHHGSRTSSTEPFVLATRPRLAIISVGQNSMFGHPHQEVVERWQANAADVLTTGQCGTISVTTDGRELTILRFVSE